MTMPAPPGGWPPGPPPAPNATVAGAPAGHSHPAGATVAGGPPAHAGPPMGGPPMGRPMGAPAGPPMGPSMAPIPAPPVRAQKSRAAGIALGGVVTLLIVGGGATGVLLCTGG